MRAIVGGVVALAVLAADAGADTPPAEPFEPPAPVLRWADVKAAALVDSYCVPVEGDRYQCETGTPAVGSASRMPIVTRRRLGLALRLPAERVSIGYIRRGTNAERQLSVV